MKYIVSFSNGKIRIRMYKTGGKNRAKFLGTIFWGDDGEVLFCNGKTALNNAIRLKESVERGELVKDHFSL